MAAFITVGLSPGAGFGGRRVNRASRRSGAPHVCPRTGREAYQPEGTPAPRTTLGPLGSYHRALLLSLSGPIHAPLSLGFLSLRRVFPKSLTLGFWLLWSLALLFGARATPPHWVNLLLSPWVTPYRDSRLFSPPAGPHQGAPPGVPAGSRLGGCSAVGVASGLRKILAVLFFSTAVGVRWRLAVAVPGVEFRIFQLIFRLPI